MNYRTEDNIIYQVWLHMFGINRPHPQQQRRVIKSGAENLGGVHLSLSFTPHTTTSYTSPHNESTSQHGRRRRRR